MIVTPFFENFVCHALRDEKLCWQLMQPNVQKCRTTTWPRRSESLRGLELIHSSAGRSWSSGGRALNSAGCWAGAGAIDAIARIVKHTAPIRQGMASLRGIGRRSTARIAPLVRNLGGGEDGDEKILGKIGRGVVRLLECRLLCLHGRPIRTQILAAVAADPQVQPQAPALERRELALHVFPKEF